MNGIFYYPASFFLTGDRNDRAGIFYFKRIGLVRYSFTFFMESKITCNAVQLPVPRQCSSGSDLHHCTGSTHHPMCDNMRQWCHREGRYSSRCMTVSGSCLQLSIRNTADPSGPGSRYGHPLEHCIRPRC